MAAAGVPLPRADHAEVMADFALAMLAALEQVNTAAEVPFYRHSEGTPLYPAGDPRNEMANPLLSRGQDDETGARA